MFLLGLVLFLSGVFLTLVTIRLLFRRRVLLAGVNGTAAISLMSVSSVLILVLLNIHTYNQLTSETLLASIDIGDKTDQGLRISLRTDNHQEEIFIQSDEWQLDARFLKLKPWAYLLGSHPAVRLETLSGRHGGRVHDLFASGARAAKKTERYNLVEQNHLIDRLGAKLGGWIGIVDTYFGSSVYMPAAEGASYKVSATFSGLLARPANKQARQAVNQWMVE